MVRTPGWLFLVFWLLMYLERHLVSLLYSAALQAQPLLFPSLLHQFPLLLLLVLNLNEHRDEGVLHFLLKLQLVSAGQLVDQFLGEVTDGTLHLVQQLRQLRPRHVPQP